MNRRIDETPSRTELLQYEKRFMELYEQIQAKHEETKRFYSQYNTTTDNQGFVNKEISLLNSIQVRGWIYMHVNREGLRTHTYAPPMDCLAVQKQFTNCLQNAASREEFKKSLETIAGSVTATLEKQQGKLNAEVRLVPSLSLSLSLFLPHHLFAMVMHVHSSLIPSLQMKGLENLEQKYSEALALQRQYFTLVREFQDECARGEKLRSQLAARQGA